MFLPKATPSEAGWPVVTWAHCMVGIGGPNAPSLRGLPRLERIHLTAWLQRGFAVAAADYLGLDAHGVTPYPYGEPLASDILDIARAVKGLGAPIGAPVIAAGFSQGADVALYAALLWQSHAPELDFRGTVALAPLDHPTFFTAVTKDEDSPVEQLVPMLLAGARAHNPTFQPRDFLTDRGNRLVELAAIASMPQMRAALAPFRNGDLGVGGMVRRLDVQRVLAEARPPVTRYQRPLLLCTTTQDILSPPGSTAHLSSRLRACGTDATFHCHEGVNHLSALPASAHDSAQWARDLLQTHPTRCIATNSDRTRS
ncbi:lipase family protein [Catellatospora sp. TT07R-123]|uniref:lipase family protein n=1 Tax=Catellatospora sp. TT07R-123 TaxID=2733863 RepID=UPI001BB419D7|nr:lipase family protein [Catellatospora sp. TT07R-123]